MDLESEIQSERIDNVAVKMDLESQIQSERINVGMKMWGVVCATVLKVWGVICAVVMKVWGVLCSGVRNVRRFPAALLHSMKMVPARARDVITVVSLKLGFVLSWAFMHLVLLLMWLFGLQFFPRLRRALQGISVRVLEALVYFLVFIFPWFLVQVVNASFALVRRVVWPRSDPRLQGRVADEYRRLVHPSVLKVGKLDGCINERGRRRVIVIGDEVPLQHDVIVQGAVRVFSVKRARGIGDFSAKFSVGPQTSPEDLYVAVTPSSVAVYVVPSRRIFETQVQTQLFLESASAKYNIATGELRLWIQPLDRGHGREVPSDLGEPYNDIGAGNDYSTDEEGDEGDEEGPAPDSEMREDAPSTNALVPVELRAPEREDAPSTNPVELRAPEMEDASPTIALVPGATDNKSSPPEE